MIAFDRPIHDLQAEAERRSSNLMYQMLLLFLMHNQKRDVEVFIRHLDSDLLLRVNNVFVSFSDQWLFTIDVDPTHAVSVGAAAKSLHRCDSIDLNFVVDKLMSTPMHRTSIRIRRGDTIVSPYFISLVGVKEDEVKKPTAFQQLKDWWDGVF